MRNYLNNLETAIETIFITIFYINLSLIKMIDELSHYHFIILIFMIDFIDIILHLNFFLFNNN
jgi:hypothetical protein